MTGEAQALREVTRSMTERLDITTPLFCQHGLADTNRTMQKLGDALVPPGGHVIAPDLGYVQTWLGMAPLIDAVEREASLWLTRCPTSVARVIGHSMGGLIWLEVLGRHPDWWPRFDRLVLLGSPIAGADVAMFAQRLGLTLAHDLAEDRRALADPIIAAIPTISIVGDLLPGSDALVNHASAQLDHARFVAVPGVTHMALRSSAIVQRLIAAFFRQPFPSGVDLNNIAERLRALAILEPSQVLLARLARIDILFADGSTIRQLRPMPGVRHVFVVGPDGACAYAGRVSAGGLPALRAVLRDLREEYADALA